MQRLGPIGRFMAAVVVTSVVDAITDIVRWAVVFTLGTC